MEGTPTGYQVTFHPSSDVARAADYNIGTMAASLAAASCANISSPTALVAFLREQALTSAAAASAGFKRMADLAPDPSPESQEKIKQFVAGGGIAAVVAAMKAHASEADISDAILTIELCECQEQGCSLLMNLAGAALAGDSTCAQALSDEHAVGAVANAIERYPESLDLKEAGLAALMQLAILDLPKALDAGLAQSVVGGMRTPQAGGWLLFLCARTLSWASSTGGPVAQEALRAAGAVGALKHALHRLASCDPDCGVPFGLADCLDQTQVVARHTLAELLSAPLAAEGGDGGDGGGDGGDEGGSYGLSGGVLRVALFVDGDCAVLTGLKAKPELNGCGGTIVNAGEDGCGPDKASSRYGFRVELPRERGGEGLMVKPANLRLAPHALAVKLRQLASPASDAAHLASKITSKLGGLSVAMAEGGGA